eukprot:CAMPEP_0197256408 /NCGR_PEP_ID=MMETSP1429-20130617/75269_1 /TAXON_ID=49237 /ORGANISM="Chaetoceros  sp., Strain UNC1202" /LENGTH=106 /DNA_ID=CAMNT_0042719965 /DNA_START=33 /DNA_END=353 /DNA_ORIENTATION=+
MICGDDKGGSSSTSNTSFCDDNASISKAYQNGSESTGHAAQVTKSCTSIDGKFTYVENKNGKTKEKSQKCSWKDVSKHCDETVRVDDHEMSLVEACPDECSADWCD